MNKIILIILSITLSTAILYAQVDQLTALKSIAEKTEFVQCNIDYTSDGKLLLYPKSTLVLLSYKHNDIGKIGSFFLNKDYIANKKSEPAQVRPDHPTKPAIFYSTFTGVGQVIIGNIVYTFKRNKKENILNGKFTVEKIYEVKSQDKKTQKGQLKGKSANIKGVDHSKILKDYFVAMKKIQENASNTMSESDKKEAALAKQIQEEKERERMGKVSADFNKAKQASATKVALKNTTSKNICIVKVANNGDKSGYTVHSNNHDAFPCNASYYYALDKHGFCGTDESLGTLIVNKDSGCNQTIELK